ncbi:uncharacterized protein BDR25DRAFT_212315, partial [Lindgomyces ingoldianus]
MALSTFDPKTQWKIDHAGAIDKSTFQILLFILLAIACVFSLSRLGFRLHHERRLFLDDYLILFATICLIIETVCIHHFSDRIYFVESASTNWEVMLLLAPGIGNTAFQQDFSTWGPAWINGYLSVGWIAIFMVKFSFLVLFWRMVRNVTKRLTIWYWVTVAVTAASGIVVVLEAFILCPHVGKAAAKCYPQKNYSFSLGIGIMVQCLDIITDLMIISIPLILLRMSQLRISHKVRIALVLCLSGIQIILSTTRIAGGIHRNITGQLEFSIVWITFLLHAEASVAVMTGSIPALHAMYSVQ